ncbi:MAG: SOS response-associated peptidase [Eubacteriaceae bacterium]
MCGSFVAPSDVKEILKKYNILKRGAITNNIGEVKFPSMLVPVIIYDEKCYENKLLEMKWGWLFKEKKFLLINARSENLFKKNLYKDVIINKRCIIPANAFFEWDDKKNKYTIRVKRSKIISLAALYKTFINDKKELIDGVVILTKEADNQLKTIHHRMPLILNEEQVSKWLNYKFIEKKDMDNFFLNDVLHYDIDCKKRVQQISFLD